MNNSIENSMKRLEEISKLMESGNLSLDESLKLYEEGAKIVSVCYKKLNDAELKIKQINYENLNFDNKDK